MLISANKILLHNLNFNPDHVLQQEPVGGLPVA